MTENTSEPELLPHHEQLDLCTSRLPYRQGRKLTAVKVYSINDESKHLLVFGVPSLNLRQETKALFSRFGKLKQFNLTKYPSEQFTETYHALFEDIQSARIAKKMLDTKNYYGGNLHICYAPELETVDETKAKLLQRQTNVINRLKNLQREPKIKKPVEIIAQNDDDEKTAEKSSSKLCDLQNGGEIKKAEGTGNKLYMGTENTIQLTKRKIKEPKPKKMKKIKHNNDSKNNTSEVKTIESASTTETANNIEIIDFTSTEKEVLTNVNESLNYNNFGKEIIKPIPYKPVNKIKFNLNKNSLL
ncbi:RNA-binding protein 48 [Trichoplusia ni]|uniref:RNA-binding protein 48 n=1 Tax=Trichoplusia ni TaxID=7111 RepID=A0A7E5V8C4_TRINI|nr:RNA-binding protein 48 [Trichoplusia ni]